MSMIGYAFTIAGFAGALPRRRGLRTGLVLAGFGAGIGNRLALQVAVHPPAGDHLAGRADDELPDRGTDFPQHLAAVAGAHRHGARGAHGFMALAGRSMQGLTVLGGIWLQFTTVAEPERSGHAAGMSDCFPAAENRAVLLCTLGVACFIAGDVGIGFSSVRLIDNPDSILTTTGFMPAASSVRWSEPQLLVRLSDVKYPRLEYGRGRWCSWCGTQRGCIYAAVGLMSFAMACVFRHLLCRETDPYEAEPTGSRGADDYGDCRRGPSRGPYAGRLSAETGTPLGMLFLAPLHAGI